jgi:hypothetical protein
MLCSLLCFRSGPFGNEVSRVLGGGLVPGLIQFLIYINMPETIYIEVVFCFMFLCMIDFATQNYQMHDALWISKSNNIVS